MNNYADIQRYSTVTSRTGMLSDSSLPWASDAPSIGSRATILPNQPLGSISQYRLSMESNEGLPPPPSVLANPLDEPLPPPPFDEYTLYEDGGGTSTPDWVPDHYIEKGTFYLLLSNLILIILQLWQFMIMKLKKKTN